MLVLGRNSGERILVPHCEPAVTVLAIEGKAVTERPFMSDNHGVTCDRDTLLENFAAELTSAAYSVALRHGIGCSWLDLELGLWRALAEPVEKWVREWPPAGSSDEFKVWQEGFLVDLTESAFYIAVKHGIKGPLLEVELYLYRAFRLAIRRVGREALRRPVITNMRHS